MPDWFHFSLTGDSATSLSLSGSRVGIALFLGAAVAGVYRWARRHEQVQSSFVTALILLAALIAMATQIIGDNVARAFSLVGALSVVRFRTVVKDTQDTAFVIFAVVVGMAVGAGNLQVGLAGLVVIGVASLFLWPPGRGDSWQHAESTLTIRIGQNNATQAAVEALLASGTSRFELIGAETDRKEASLDLTYRLRLVRGRSPAELVTVLTQLPGVESVGLDRRN